MKISFVIPAYNEADEIEKNINTIYNFAKQNYSDFEIIAIDDGSKDNTLDVMRKLSLPNLIVDTNGKNMGPGAAFRKGFELATGDLIVSTESDLSYPIEDAKKLLAKLEEGYDIALATPHLAKEDAPKNVPAHRLALSHMGTAIYTFFVGEKLSTYACFFRAYKKQVIKSIQFKSNGFESQVEILWRAHKKGYKIIEISSKQNFRADRPSKFNIPRELGRHLNFLFGTVIPGNVEDVFAKK